MISIRRAHIGGLDLNGDTISRGSVKCRWFLAWECRCGSLGYSVPGPVLSFLFVSCLHEVNSVFLTPAPTARMFYPSAWEPAAVDQLF